MLQLQTAIRHPSLAVILPSCSPTTKKVARESYLPIYFPISSLILSTIMGGFTA